MPSKSLHRFQQRLLSYRSDLELADLLIANFRALPSDNRTVCQVIGGREDVYTRLHANPNTNQSRKILGLHLKKTLYVAFVKELYEDFSEFMATSLSRAALAGVDAARFAGEGKLEIHAKEILHAGSWEAVIRLISDKIFRALENERKTRDLIAKMSNRIGLAIDAAHLDAAMPYLDARHILVHRDGKPDDLYTRTYPAIRLQQNGEIKLNFDFVNSARATVTALAEHIDERMIAANLVRPQDMAWQRQGVAQG